MLSGGCRHKPTTVPDLQQSTAGLEGIWLQAPEETHGDTLLYRPNTYHFRHWEQRSGFRIGAFGRFTQFDPAPTGGLLARPGTWAVASSGRLLIHLAAGPQPDYILEIVALRQGRLLLRQQQPAATVVSP